MNPGPIAAKAGVTITKMPAMRGEPERNAVGGQRIACNRSIAAHSPNQMAPIKPKASVSSISLA